MPQKSHKPHGKRGNPNPKAPPKGTRFGGGRPPMKQRHHERDIARAEAEGITPKFALLAVMRSYLEEHARIVDMRPAYPEPATPAKIKRWRIAMAEWREEWSSTLELVRVAARDAAPYFHARLSAIKVQGYGLEDVQKIPIESLSNEQLALLEQRLLAAAGHATDLELDPGGAGEAGGRFEESVREVPGQAG